MLKRVLGAVVAVAVAFILAGTALAEKICVKYGQCPLDLSSFDCRDATRSSFIGQVCYDADQTFMVVLLRDIYYPYCAIDEATVEAFLTAPSMGRFYNENIRSPLGGGYGPFDCRVRPMP